MSDSELSKVGIGRAVKERIRGAVSIAGIGNIMRGDDGLGPKLIELLKARGTNAGLFDCGTAPENYIFPMLRSACDTLILVDAADLGLKPGETSVLDVENISNISFSTHSPSPRLFIDLLKMGKEDLNIFVITMQPKTTALGAPISEEIHVALGALAETLSEILS